MQIYTKDIKASDYITPAVKLIHHWDTINNRQRDEFHFEDSLILLLFSDKVPKQKAEELFLTYLIKENIMHVIDKEPQTKQKLIDIIINQKAIEFFDENEDINFDDNFIQHDFKHWSELVEILKDDYHLKSTFKMNKGNQLGSLSKKVAADPNIVQVDLFNDFDFFSSAKEEEEEENKNGRPLEYTDYTDYVDLYNEIKDKFSNNQHKTIALCTDERRQRVFALLQQNYIMSQCIKTFDQEESIESIRQMPIKQLLRICNQCSREQFMDYVYSKNPKNQILLIIYITKLYFSNASFMKTLEDNYGVLLQNQLYEVKHKLKEAQDSIHNYTELLNTIKCGSYLGSEFEYYLQIYDK